MSQALTIYMILLTFLAFVSMLTFAGNNKAGWAVMMTFFFMFDFAAAHWCVENIWSMK